MVTEFDNSLQHASVYADPELDCDLVMKGGITSGVAYPLAVCELAKKYRLRNIGGTSAGAIAAAAAAAAEHGRGSTDGGFARLAALPTWLAGRSQSARRGSNLRHLFQPQRATRPTFDVAIAAVEQGSGAARALRVTLAALRHHPLAALIGALCGGSLIAAAAVWGQGVTGWLLAAAGLVLAAVGAAAAEAIAAVRSALHTIPKNGFGLCSGLSPVDGKGPSALTPWLFEELQTISGRGPGDPPLTFGDLEDKGIKLAMLTTNLTNGTPYRVPLDTRIFFYRKEEMERLFPKAVVEHMVASSQQQPDWEQRSPWLPMPEAAKLPVIVGVRLSLSFPILLSAVPLWSPEFGIGEPGEESMIRNWLSDGGITSNFPIHFFDRPLPSRPTFAVNLAPRDELDQEDQCRNVRLPATNLQGIRPRWSSFGTVAGFLGAILDTMQNWSDNAQARVPAYRDRIVTIYHTKDEGGLNLDMPDAAVKAMSARGRCAGAALVRDFDFDNHRWVRFRSFMELFEDMLPQIRTAFTAQPSDARAFDDLINDPPSYRKGWSEARKAYFRSRTGHVIDLSLNWPDPDGRHSFDSEAPKPTAVLRVTPVV